MMKITRINDDSSWSLQCGNTHCLLDPWLRGDDINLAPWFSRQWLTKPTLAIDKIAAVDCILISHPFSDHCSEATLALFPKHVPVFTVQPAARRIERMKHFERIEILPKWNNTQAVQSVGDMEITFFASGKAVDPTHNAFLLRNIKSNETIFYAPHGFVIPDKGALHDHLYHCAPKLVITTFRYYGLPFFLGGAVNLGTESAIALIKSLKPQSVLRTHDAHKAECGLVTKIAQQSIHPDPQSVLKANGMDVRYCESGVGETITL